MRVPKQPQAPTLRRQCVSGCLAVLNLGTWCKKLDRLGESSTGGSPRAKDGENRNHCKNLLIISLPDGAEGPRTLLNSLKISFALCCLAPLSWMFFRGGTCASYSCCAPQAPRLAHSFLSLLIIGTVTLHFVKPGPRVSCAMKIPSWNYSVETLLFVRCSHPSLC